MQPIAIRLGASLTSGCAEQSGDLLRLAFGYGTTENNGNILTQDISRDAAGFSSSQIYAYDGLNRLRSITEGSGAQTYVYDRYGNRAVRSDSYIPIAAQTPVVSSDTEAAVTAIFPSNRWWDGTPGTLNYDAAGNQTLRFGGSFVYDAENRVTSSTVGTVTTTYAYDGEGRRVKKDAVVMVYDAFGKLAAEYGGTSTGAGRQYLTADHLGSTRLVTNSTGGDMKCSDYLPFGEEISQGVNSRGTCYATFTDPRQKFTGKERDSETGLDFFLARYYSGAQGRFTSPDEFTGGIVDPFTGQQVGQTGPLPYADITNPQSLNKYAYTMNNPLRYVDPNGHEAAEADTLIDIAIGEIDKVARPLINSAYETAASGGKMAARGAGTLLAVPLLVLTTAVQAGGNSEVEWERQNAQRTKQGLPWLPPGATPGTPNQPGQPNRTSPAPQNASEHKKGARPSTQEKHEAGQTRKKKDRGGERGDERRRPPRTRPDGWKGPWPPKDGQVWH